MTEADVWMALIQTLRDGLDSQGQSGIAIQQAYQPTTQGVNTQNTVYLFKVNSTRVGFQGKKDTFNSGNNNFDTQENYWLQALFQLNAIVKRDINDSSSLTSYDIADLCAAILQSISAREKLLESSIGILRIGDIRNPYSIDDLDEFEQDSSFDFNLTYNQTINSFTPIADPIDADIQRI